MPKRAPTRISWRREVTRGSREGKEEGGCPSHSEPGSSRKRRGKSRVPCMMRSAKQFHCDHAVENDMPMERTNHAERTQAKQCYITKSSRAAETRLPSQFVNRGEHCGKVTFGNILSRFAQIPSVAASLKKTSANSELSLRKFPCLNPATGELPVYVHRFVSRPAKGF